MDGPSSAVRAVSTPETDMNNLTIRDIYIIKQFLEKGTRNKLFSEQEQFTVNVIHTKVENIIQEALNEKEKKEEKEE